MKSSDRVKAEEQYFALDMICNIIVMYEQATRGRRGRETGVMTRAGMDVFEALSFQRGAFVRPVPLDREDLMERCQLNGRRIDQAVRRLIAEGFVTLSGLTRPANGSTSYTYTRVRDLSAHYQWPGGRLRKNSA